ncbi:MAG: hypothetical protein ACOYNI_02985 [Acidimicrobiia bacterium]
MGRAAFRGIGALALALLMPVACSGDGGSKGSQPRSTSTTAKAESSSSTPATGSFAGSLLALTTADTKNGRVQLQLVVLDDDYRGRATIDLGPPVSDADVPARASIVADSTAAWIVTSVGGRSQVRRVTPNGGTSVVNVDTADARLAVGAGAAWVAADSSVIQLSSADGTMLASIPGSAFPSGFVARHIAVSGGRVWVASDNGALVSIDPTTRVVTPAPAVLAFCKKPAQTPEELAANERDVVRSMAAVGQYVDVVVTDGCGPANAVVAFDPLSGARLPVALPGPENQPQRALAAGVRLVVARVKSNDLVVVEPSSPVGAPIVLPDGALAETCGAAARGVACTSGLDEVAFVALGGSGAAAGKPTVETHRSRAIDGGALAWAVL